MRIDRLTIKNFKNFDDKTFIFNPNFNLFVGINGSGKTSVLDALAVALGGWFLGFVDGHEKRRPIKTNEIRLMDKDKRFNPMTPVEVDAFGQAQVIIDGVVSTEKICWWRKRKSAERNYTDINGVIVNQDYSQDDAGQQLKLKDSVGKNSFYFKGFGQEILKHMENGGQFDLPVIAYYGCGRLWSSKQPNIEQAAKVQYSHFDPFKDSFSPAVNSQALNEWLFKQELISLQKRSASYALKLVKKALVDCIEDCTGLSFDIEESRVIVEFKEGIRTPFDCLSDGQRTMFAMVGDLIFRAVTLNPHLGERVLEETAGVVLIDELDLHLHPKWQRRVIKDLRRTFPKIQFFASTHSPQIIGQAQPEEIILLDSKAKEHPGQSFGMDSNWVLQVLMGADEQDADVKLQLEKIFRLIKGKNLEDAEKLISELRLKIGNSETLQRAASSIERVRLLGR